MRSTKQLLVNRRPAFGFSSWDWKLLIQIFWAFFKIGPVTFGGGYSVIPVIENVIVEKRQWLAKQEAADVLAITQSIPGAIAINSATFVGFKLARVPGAVAALLGILLPTLLIVLGLGVVYSQIQDNPKIEAAFKAIKATIVALIVYAGIKLWKSAVLDKTTLAAVVVTAALIIITNLNPIIIIIGGAALGILLVKMKEKLGMKVKLSREEEPGHDYKDYFWGDGI
jgi:chromate transporter